MIYNQKIKSAVHSIKAPHEFVIDIIEYDMQGHQFLGIRFYESQWEYYNEKERLDCILYLDKVKSIIEGFGVRATLDPVIDTGNNLPTKKKVRGKGITK
jgi:hypothetical protein